MVSQKRYLWYCFSWWFSNWTFNYNELIKKKKNNKEKCESKNLIPESLIMIGATDGVMKIIQQNDLGIQSSISGWSYFRFLLC